VGSAIRAAAFLEPQQWQEVRRTRRAATVPTLVVPLFNRFHCLRNCDGESSNIVPNGGDGDGSVVVSPRAGVLPGSSWKSAGNRVKRGKRGKRGKRETFKVGFINANGCKKATKWQELFVAAEELDLDILAVAETHLCDLERPLVIPEYKWFGCNRLEGESSYGGVGFLVKKTVRTFDDSQDQSGLGKDNAWIHCNYKGQRVTFGVVYFSHQNSREEESMLMEQIKDITKARRQLGDEVLIMGDFNGHLRELGGVRTDQRGKHVKALAKFIGGAILNMSDKCQGKYTYMSGIRKTCIDYMIATDGLESHLRSIVIDENKSYSPGSDHNLMYATLDGGIANRITNRPRTKTRISRAKVGKIMDDSVFWQRLQESSLEEFPGLLQQAQKSAQETVFLSEKANFWWNDTIKETRKLRQQASKRWNEAVRHDASPELIHELFTRYTELRVATSSLIEVSKRDCDKKIKEWIMSAPKGERMARFWKYHKNECFKSRAAVLDDLGDHLTDEDGEKVSDPEAFLTGILTKLLEVGEKGGNSNGSSEPWGDTGIGVTPKDVEEAVSLLREDTSTGEDEISAMFLKMLGGKLCARLASYFNAIFAGKATVPPEWQTGRVILIPKGDQNFVRDQDISKARPLTITSVIYRLFMRIFKDKVVGWAEDPEAPIFTELQSGFRSGRRLDDNVFMLSQICEISRGKGLGMYCAFLDIKKAYDTVNHGKLWEILATKGMNKNWIGLLRELYAENMVVLKHRSFQSKAMVQTSGLRQGCPMSAVLFMLYINNLEKRLVEKGIGFKLSYRCHGEQQFIIPALFYADDIVLISNNRRELQELLNICNEEVTSLGLAFNHDKCAILCFNNSCEERSDIGPHTLQDGILKFRREYKYLGVLFTIDPEPLKKHEQCLMEKAAKFYNILKSQVLWRYDRLFNSYMLWKAVFVPSLTFCNASLRYSTGLLDRLERIQYQVGKFALGVRANVAKAFIDGELPWSSFELREARAKLTFAGRFRIVPPDRLIARLQLAKACLRIRTAWDVRVNFLRRKYGCDTVELPQSPAEFGSFSREVKNKSQLNADCHWKAAMEKKSSLERYRKCKSVKCLEAFYDNSRGSQLLAEARAGLLKTKEFRQIHFQSDHGISTTCPRCQSGADNLKHILYECVASTRLLSTDVSIDEALGLVENASKTVSSEVKKILDEWYRKTIW
jgi:exonuclease III